MVDEEQHRISCANLVWWVAARDHPTLAFGILNPKALKKGERKIQALGGAAHLTDKARQHLSDWHSAREFEKDGDFWDARFRVDKWEVEHVMRILSRRDSNFIELDPTRELVSEITGAKYPDEERILMPSQMDGFAVRYIRTTRQATPVDGIGSSSRAVVGVPSHRLFHVFALVLLEQSYKALLASPYVRVLHPWELATTKGGAKVGTTDNGETIADNLFL